MNALCITKGKACLCVSLHNHQFCLVHDACEMSPIILGTKFIKKQYNLNFPKDCRWKLWLIKWMTWKRTHHNQLRKWWFCWLVWGNSNLWSMNCRSLITLVKTDNFLCSQRSLKIVLDFVHEQTPAWEEAYKEAHSRNQVHQAGTNGCSLDGVGRVDLYLILDSTRMGGHSFSVLTCLSHSTNASSWLVIHLNVSITHQRIFWNGCPVNQRWAFKSGSFSKWQLPWDFRSPPLFHKQIYEITHSHAVFETKGIISSNSCVEKSWSTV